MSKKNGKVRKSAKSIMAFIQEFFGVIGGIFGSIMTIYGFFKMVQDDADGYAWFILFGIIILLLVMWQMFKWRKTYARVVMVLAMVGVVIGGAGWQGQIQAKKDKVVVLVAEFDGPEEMYGLRDQIMEELHSVVQGGDIVIIDGREVITSGQGSAYARELGAKNNADLVIWAWYKSTENPNITIHFENLATAHIQVVKSSEMYQPQATLEELESFNVQQKIGSETKTLISFIAGMLDYQLNDYQKALGHLESILLEEDISTYIDPVTLYNYVGLLNLRLGRYQNSIDNYTYLLTLNPDYLWAYTNRGVDYYRLEDYEKSLQDHSKALELNPDYPLGYSNRAGVYFKLKEYSLALADYDKAVEIDPTYASAYAGRGDVYQGLDDYERAIKEYNKAILMDPNLDWAHSGLGRAYYSLKEYEKAINAYNKAIKLESQNSSVFYNRGIAYQALKKQKSAIRDFNKAIELDPYNIMAYTERGNSYLDLYQYDKAFEDFEKVIQLAPDTFEAYSGRGRIYYFQQDYSRALSDYNKSIELGNDSAWIFNNRGAAYAEMNEYEKAIQDYNLSISIDPNLSTAYRNRWEAYKHIDKIAESEADFEKFKELTGYKPMEYNPNLFLFASKVLKYQTTLLYISAIGLILCIIILVKYTELGKTNTVLPKRTRHRS